MSEGVGDLVEEVLVPVQAADPADRGVAAAVRLAAASGRGMRLLHVRSPAAEGPDPRPDTLLRQLHDAQPGLHVDWEVVGGDDVPATVLHAPVPAR